MSGGSIIEHRQLRQEIPQICDNAARVCEALCEFAVSMKWFSTAARAIKVCAFSVRCVERGLECCC